MDNFVAVRFDHSVFANAVYIYETFNPGSVHQGIMITLLLPLCLLLWSVLELKIKYRVTMVVAHLGWFDLDSRCSTLLWGSR